MTIAHLEQGDIIDLISDIFQRRGAEAYAGEALTVAEHMLQTAALAQAEDVPDTLVAAALLHDIGHFTSELGEYMPGDTADKRHDEAGAAWLAAFFPPAVTDCIRMHVAAKRYLCATEPPYYDLLSAASKHSLLLQGGAMSDAEVAAFRGRAFYEDAVRLRRWDDSGKIEGLRTMRFAQYRPLLERVLARN
jgi:phosphonate degradation associated HDIG domain protein